jgi:hypothetical protein
MLIRESTMFVAVALGSVLLAQAAHAQRIDYRSRAGVSRPAPSIAASQSDDNTTTIRLASSVGGLLAGVVAGGFAGYNLLPHTCECDDPGLDQLIYGAVVGGAVGAAFGAAYPSLGSVCTFEQRFKRSIVGAGAGALLALVATVGSSSGDAIIFVAPVASVGGALGALGRCWKPGTSTRTS